METFKQSHRKCKICKHEIILEADKLVLEKEFYYHYACFIEKVITQKKNKLELEKAIELAENLIIENQVKVNHIILKDKFNYWLQRIYDVVLVPSYFYTKLESIYNGSYKGLSQAIPIEDLFDAWQRKIDYLNNQYVYNLGHGKKMDGVGRLNYDLAIILNKMTSYYEWKRGNEAENMAKKETIANQGNKISYEKLQDNNKDNKNNVPEINKLKDNKINILDILEEI